MSIPGSASPLFFGAGVEAAAFQIDRSLRFSDSASSHLNKTFSSAGNRKTWTWSGWVKRANLDSSVFSLFAAYESSNTRDVLRIESNKLNLQIGTSGTYRTETTDAFFRDPAAWYHIVAAFDSAQSTAADRVKLYVNGVEQSVTGTPVDQNTQSTINNADIHYIGARSTSGSARSFFDGYLTEINFVDGQALAPTDFGEYDDNNVWQPKDTSGLTFGTNGFRLKFDDNSSAAALGNDSSGNENDFTVNNLTAKSPGDYDAPRNFGIVTYTGTGSTQSLELPFQPDFVWIKNRSSTYQHLLFDSVRGATKYLKTDATSGEQTNASTLSSFNSDGFTLGGDNEINKSSETYVAWCWKANGTAVSNTDGTITSSVSANPDYGFSVLKWSGDGTDANKTVGHGLSSAPKLIIIKSRDESRHWLIWHESLDNDEAFLFTNGTAAGSRFGPNAPTSSVFGVYGGQGNRGTTGFIGYCWSEISGFSKFGSYSGGTNNQTITTGFKPAFLLIKRSDGSNEWIVIDSKRGGTKKLSPSLNVAENDGTYLGGDSSNTVEFLADGFKLTSTNAETNGSGQTHIYAAFAGTPAGEEDDSLLDTPTNYSVDSGNPGGNYCTFNPVDKGSSVTLSNGNLDFTASTSNHGTRGTIGVSSGKWYWEVTVTTANNGQVGIAKSTASITLQIGGDADGYSFHVGNGNKQNNGSYVSYASGCSSGDVVGVALDLDSSPTTLTFYKNGSSLGTAYSGISGTFFPAVSRTSGSSVEYAANFGQRSFAYTPPSNHLALVTTNLPDPTIADGSTAFDVALWTGNGSSAQTISTPNLSPDMVWFKERSSTSSHAIVDAVRGATNAAKVLYPDRTDAEATGSATSSITSLNSDGFTIGSSDNSINQSSQTYVGWAWDAGTSTVSNTDGSITSSVRANQTAGFSIVTATQGSGDSTWGHGLNTKPDLIILKARNQSYGWFVSHSGLDNQSTKFLQLHNTSAVTTNSNWFASTEPTSSVITTKAGGMWNSGDDFVAYCWAAVEGFSAFGSYVSNNSTDGPFVFLGFQAKLIIWKNRDDAHGWYMYDDARDPHNVMAKYLGVHQNNAEAEPGGAMDILSNGFKVRNTGSDMNTGSNTIIYMAWAEHPFKHSRAR